MNEQQNFQWGEHICHLGGADGKTRYPYAPSAVQYEDSTREAGTVYASHGMVDMSIRLATPASETRKVLRCSNFSDPTSRIPLSAFSLCVPSSGSSPAATIVMSLADLLSDADLLRELGGGDGLQIHKDGLLEKDIDAVGALNTGGVMLMDPEDAGKSYDILMRQYLSNEGSLLVLAVTATNITVDFHPSGSLNVVRFRLSDGTEGRWQVERFDQSTAEGRKAAFDGLHPSSEAFIISVPVEEVGKPVYRSRGGGKPAQDEMEMGDESAEEDEEEEEGFSLFDDEPPQPKSKKARPAALTILEEHGFEFLKHSLVSTNAKWSPTDCKWPIRRLPGSMVRIVHRIPAAFKSSSKTTPSPAILASIQKRVDAVHRNLPSMEIFGHVARLQAMQAAGRLRRIASEEAGSVAAQAAKEGVVCIICCEAALSGVAMPCGHMIACAECSLEFERKPCPICRVQVSKIVSEADATEAKTRVIAHGFLRD